jgi:uncharacterized protein YggT (Ycf19 family)
MKDVTIAEDQNRQAAQHEAVKSDVQGHVNAEIAGQAASASTSEQAKIGEVAAQLRDTALAETVDGERTVGRGRTAARGSQFIDYGFYVVYALLAVRVVLGVIAARSDNGFVRLVRAVTDPFYAPFRGIVDSPSAEGGSILVVPILIAIVVYALLHAGINGMLRMVAQRKTVI